MKNFENKFLFRFRWQFAGFLKFVFFHIATPVFLQPSLLYIIGWLASQSFIQFNKKEKRFQIWCDLPKEARSCSPRGSHSNNNPATAPSIAFYCPSSCVLPSFSIAFSCLPSLCIALCRLSPTVVLYQLELYLHSDSVLTLPVPKKRRERVFKLQENCLDFTLWLISGVVD